MNARHKLNEMYVYGSAFIGLLGGALTGSWWVFFLVTGLLIGGAAYSGDIRVASKPKGKLGR
ncbi:MAG: hypothetical protein KF752_09495 [Pirellulaceae bacterium]|nr:hypothetical protein [Pirellulaceae bacterium]